MLKAKRIFFKKTNQRKNKVYHFIQWKEDNIVDQRGYEWSLENPSNQSTQVNCHRLYSPKVNTYLANINNSSDRGGEAEQLHKDQRFKAWFPLWSPTLNLT